MTKAMKQMGALALTMTASSIAHAGLDCSGSHGGWRMQTSDDWTGSDKLVHLVASAPFGALGAYLTRDTEHPVIYGTLIGTAPGFAKEILDGTCRTDGFSYKDLAADALGALIGASLTHWAIMYQRNAHSMTIGLKYSSRF
ncbi:lipoprotein [Caballeronia peredens]|nr:lipoprotein [Caballeronia peredens]